jgi:hypothetical protein
MSQSVMSKIYSDNIKKSPYSREEPSWFKQIGHVVLTSNNSFKPYTTLKGGLQPPEQYVTNILPSRKPHMFGGYVFPKM